jgi:hypothetical protein
VSRDESLSATEILTWAVLGVGAGLAAGFVLGEWMGGVNPDRVRGAARRLRQGAPLRLTPAASVRTVEAALQGEPRLHGLAIDVVSFARGVVAGRTALAAHGIDSVINSILVHGEDDQAMRKAPRATDQSA